ncbi:MAG: hypothetical protein IKZ87_01760 [Actinomycetaceae bacterium]|nr:hypothetical protein [Actinomycetaceae bacterium]
MKQLRNSTIRNASRKHDEKESGMVSAETALATLALALVFTLMLSVIGASALYLHAQDMSRAAARSLTLGHSYEQVRASVYESDSRAQLSVHQDGKSLAVTVEVVPPRPIQALGVSITATTVAPLEPGTSP